MLGDVERYFVAAVRRIYTSRAKFALGWALRTSAGRQLALSMVERAKTSVHRRLMIEGIQLLNATETEQRRFIEAARQYLARMQESPIRFDILALALIYSAEQKAAWRHVSSAQADEIIADDKTDTNLLGTRIALGHETEHYRNVVAAARLSVMREPDKLRERLDGLKSAFAASKLLQLREAIEYVGRQYSIIPDHPGDATDREIQNVIDCSAKAVLHTLKDDIDFRKLKGASNERIAVFFLSSTQALGHAVLDPYYFVALNRDKFDRFVFIGPPKSAYRPASAACLQIVEQYGDYVETGSDLLLNLSWMSLGHHTIGPMSLIIDNYWALLRSAVLRSRDDKDAFHHNSWHFKLPAYYQRIGEAFCARHGIDLTRPLIVMHVRDKGYHGIARQSFRDASVEGYRDAVEYLLERGYQVIRIGDATMPTLTVGKSGYFELPFLKGYRHELDPYLISLSRFMIGCQSGPCAFARALGVPILTINAVLHYTLLPSTMEMACFKHYFRLEPHGRKELTLIEALDARVDQFDNSYHFENAGIVVENATPAEILAATRDMDAWIDNPDLDETAAQRAFRARVDIQNIALINEGDSLPLPVADYIGISLPGYRISPTVAEMREPAASVPKEMGTGSEPPIELPTPVRKSAVAASLPAA